MPDVASTPLKSDKGLALGTVAACARFVDLGVDGSPQEQGSEDTLPAWSTPLAARAAQSIIDTLVPDDDQQPSETTPKFIFASRHQLAHSLLSEQVRPLFSSAPHPMLNPQTARKLDRARGGDHFSDTWVDPTWKGKSRETQIIGAIGSWRVFRYAISLLNPQDVESVWPLVVPPLMTLLDDHEVRYRLEGIKACATFLVKCPPVLLQRTGLKDLIQKVSHDPKMPRLAPRST